MLARKRRGESLRVEDVRYVVEGATSGSWDDAQLGAFLMAAAIRGLDAEETRALTVAMLESGDRWELAAEFPTVGDKHSTGGVGDKVSLILSPILAACGQPVVMLTGRGLGHTGGTADKLETIPELDLALDRRRTTKLLNGCGMAIGMATGSIAPADRKLYSLRDVTATVDSIPLIVGSILSKKLATGAAGIAFDVKTGSGAFLPEIERAAELARLLVETSTALGVPASALLTDMSQPLGRWVGHAAEVAETVACLEGRGPDDLMTVVYELCQDVAALTGVGLTRSELERAVASGAARERFGTWVESQGGRPEWLDGPVELAGEEAPILARAEGYLGAVACQRLGLALARAGGGRVRQGDAIHPGVSLERRCSLGEPVSPGRELARLYLHSADDGIVAEVAACFEISPEPVSAPALIGERMRPA